MGVVADLPPAALADLIERLVDKLDATEPDPGGEAENEGCCDAGDDDPASSVRCLLHTADRKPGDPIDGEPDMDDGEPDSKDEPVFCQAEDPQHHFTAATYVLPRPIRSLGR